jgi:hypothetical protein
MLLLPRVGVSQTVALAAAALLAIGQMQVYYAQEVREYGLSILVAAWMLMAGLHAGRTGRWIPLAIAGAAAPWLSYGPCFAYLAVLGWLGVYRVLGRFQITWKHLALAAAAFFVAAGLAYAFVARHQLGLGQQWYLAEHYLGASGLNPVVWLAANTGGVLLASLPGLIGVVLGAGLGLVWIVQRLGRPLRLLDEPVIVLAGFLIVGMAAAGVLGIYPYGSPRHSVFLAPFFVLAIAAAATSLLQESPASLRLPAAGVLVGAFAVAGALGLLGVTPGAGLHPILAKVGAVRVYGEYQDGRSLVAFARTQAETPLYAVVGAVPAVNYYGADMAVIRGDISLSGRPGPQAEHVLRAAGGTPILVLASNLQDGELDALIAELRARGATVEQVFAATRAWALQVRPE